MREMNKKEGRELLEELIISTLGPNDRKKYFEALNAIDLLSDETIEIIAHKIDIELDDKPDAVGIELQPLKRKEIREIYFTQVRCRIELSKRERKRR